MVLIIDEAQRLSTNELTWLMGVQNELDDEGVRLTTVQVGSHELGYVPDSDGGFGGHVRAVAELLRSACARWPDVFGSHAFPYRASHFVRFRRWLEVTQDRVAKLRRQNVASLGESLYSLDDIDIILGRLDAMAPIPTELFDLFLVPTCQQQLERAEVTRDVASVIKVVDKKFPLRYLLWFFKKYEALFASRRSWRLLAAQGIEKLKHEHTVCRCHWAWDRYGGWGPIYSDEERPSWRLCPYEYAIDELKESWLVFASTEASHQAVNKIESRFLAGCRAVLEGGLGYLPNPPIRWPEHRGLFPGLLLPKLTFGEDVESVLDSLLAGQVAAHCEGLTAWLASISSDRKPIRTTPAGSVNLFLDDSAAWVSTWKRLGSRYVGAVARWDEGIQSRP